jgi:hypothetical protein
MAVPPWVTGWLGIYNAGFDVCEYAIPGIKLDVSFCGYVGI